jgi:hypothetical protein
VNAEAAAARWLVVLLGVAGLSGGALAAAVMLAAR